MLLLTRSEGGECMPLDALRYRTTNEKKLGGGWLANPACGGVDMHGWRKIWILYCHLISLTFDRRDSVSGQ